MKTMLVYITVAPMCNTQKKILVHKQELKSTNKIFNTQFEV
jgi:hypothetical protein